MANSLEISIPQTSVAITPQGKPYTQYHIVLQLPLRREEARKRYNDFVELHRDLTAQTGSVPTSLPAKNWFSRTVNNDALTEERRAALETYVKTIVTSSDARWRSSKAWRKFMNLPEGTSAIDAKGNLKTISADRNTIDSSRWLDMHRELKNIIQIARQQVKQKDAATSVQEQHSLAADAKASLIRASSVAQQLDGALPGLTDLGDGEIRRRRDLVVAARREVQGLEGILKSSVVTQKAPPIDAAAKDALLNTANPRAKGRVLGGPLKETERTRELDNEGVLQLQKQIMKEQDEDVALLGQNVARLKDMGIMINEELAIQSEMLGMVEEDVDRVQGKIDVGRNRIKKIK